MWQLIHKGVGFGAIRLSAYGGLLVIATIAFTSGCAVRPVSDGAVPAEAEERSEHLASQGFYQRRAAGNGWFMTRSEFGTAQSRTLSDVLRITPGVNVVGRSGGAMLANNRSAGRCPLAVFVDGSYTTIRNVDELTLEDIEALEVYRGPSEVPLKFTAPTYDRTCGALLVWSRMEVGDD